MHSEGAKKLSSRYNTRRKLELGILSDGKVIRLPFLQILKHQIHRILELLIILPNLHGIDELDESRKVLFLLRCLIMNVANESTVEQRLCL